ncbi:MAG TPA: arylesterase [Novosphingobium sp.]|nr:arylesterase [Novosphingobium sp.]HNN56120.1 arylesterase [Novosphingobium sp.]
MKWKLPLALATLALAACGQDRAPPAPVASDAEQMPALPVVGEEVTILALGDSLFAGYGLDPGQSYPARLEAALRAHGVNARIVNAGVSGDTTADGLARIDFALDSLKQPPALVLVSLGGNDMLRAVPPEQTRANIDALLGKLDARKVSVLVLGMKAAPNLGPDYQRAFDALYPELTKKHGDALVPFFLEPVYDKPQLLQADHIHPTLQGIDALVGSTADQVVTALPAKAVKAAPPAPR